ncbi:hypothetical protein NDU88_011072 [Pleurodeles waltl]|uniref:Uncharacterized protein n=1 Tax=Pleurodeles waltl TaxID=8319 RepID=A0AAV7QW62_PLEWA|nr:hypothetical protein NDU88_011072 [Pleurodeles waltl]
MSGTRAVPVAYTFVEQADVLLAGADWDLKASTRPECGMDSISTEAARRASLFIGSLQRSREGWAVKGVAPPPQEETIRRRIQKETTGERTAQRRSDHGGAEAGDAWNPWEESGPEPTPLQYRPRDEDRWPRGA